MSRVLVTGATGFVGRSTLPLLRAAGWNVRAALRREGLRPPGTEAVVIGELGPETEWGAALSGVDTVLHLAGLAHQIGRNGPDIEAAFDRVNRAGTERLARAVAASPSVKRFVFVSSIGAVASFAEQPLDETAAARPDTAYGRSKLAAERAVESSLQGTRVDWVIVRPPLVYGPGNPGNMARLLSLVRLGIPLPFASLRNARSFLAVSNLAELLVLALASPAASRRVYHVCDAETWSTPQLLRVLAAAAGVRCRLFPCPPRWLRVGARTMDIAGRLLRKGPCWGSYALQRLAGSLVVDASRVRRELGWSPRRSLPDEAPAMVAEAAEGA